MVAGILRVERETKSLREMTLDKMRRAILDQHFKPGDRLVERELCDQLAVSRSVVREVLRHLEAEGIVEIVPNRGPIVAVLTRAQARQIYEVRGYLEALAARGCAESPDAPAVADVLDARLLRIAHGYATNDAALILEATAEFYERMFLASGREIAWDIVSALHMRITHLRSITIATPGRATDGPEEMRRIVAAIRARDGETAFQASLSHVQRAETLAISEITT
ncbi:GntR family transcriptional regulator [Methylobacterium organophilum]|uniref:HTH-type transcriptional repressor RspR n=1 Tax=Methylobacterium organophilum TaxID=410 RepID=A0ABQ4T8T9_METOR|nr:GntR family transcriptional regulator [Methylobacterium organophilum]GJE27668.1 HTH-type transcriptional repressor RspR [Methylobacterium organophilum]